MLHEWIKSSLKTTLNTTYKLEVSTLLYKYMTPEKIEFFDNVSLRFTPPMDLNDPFECRPILKYKNSVRYIDQYIKERLKITPDLLMKQHPNLSRSEARKIAKSAAKEMKRDFMRNIKSKSCT